MGGKDDGNYCYAVVIAIYLAHIDRIGYTLK